MIPSVVELTDEIALRRAIELAAQSAPNPEAAEIQATALVEQIRYELAVVRAERRSQRTSVEVSFNASERHGPSLNRIRLFLVAKGYTVIVIEDVVTISWSN